MRISIISFVVLVYELSGLARLHDSIFCWTISSFSPQSFLTEKLLQEFLLLKRVKGNEIMFRLLYYIDMESSEKCARVRS